MIKPVVTPWYSNLKTHQFQQGFTAINQTNQKRNKLYLIRTLYVKYSIIYLTAKLQMHLLFSLKKISQGRILKKKGKKLLWLTLWHSVTIIHCPHSVGVCVCLNWQEICSHMTCTPVQTRQTSLSADFRHKTGPTDSSWQPIRRERQTGWECEQWRLNLVNQFNTRREN